MHGPAGTVSLALTVFLSAWLLGTVPLALSSTDGRQLPAYFCNLARLPENPTTLGGYISLFQLATNPGPAPQLMDGFSKACGKPLDASPGSVSETQQLFASWHSAAVQNTGITDTPNNIHISVRGTLPSVTSTTLTPVPDGQLVRGALHALWVRSYPGGFFDFNTALDGAIIYAALNSSDLQRVGSFVNTGPNMAGWLACGPNNGGVVHTQVLSDTGEYPEGGTDDNGNYIPAPPSRGLIWQAPTIAAGSVVVFKGHGVTDLGFGPLTQSFTMVNAPNSG